MDTARLKEREQAYRDRWPEIPWTKPSTVRRPDKTETRYACRLCVAMYGLKGSAFGTLALTAQEVEAHITAEHTLRN